MKVNIENQCREALKKYEDEYEFVGIRFEDKERKIGDICENSRHNLEREDEREFPEYGTAEYEEMFELDGTSAWDLKNYDEFEGYFNSYHCYIVAGDDITNINDALDYNEIVIKNAVVLEKLF